MAGHIRGDDDLIESWLSHYMSMGVSCFYLILHGGRRENQRLWGLRSRFPIDVTEEYDGEFSAEEKKRRGNRLLAQLAPGWCLWVDSDEFVELPYATLSRTVAVLNWLGHAELSAPLVQRIGRDGDLNDLRDSEPVSAAYPLCSPHLYKLMGVPDASTMKFPLFYNSPGISLRDGGNHNPPSGGRRTWYPVQGVTHHFKWRASGFQRLRERAESNHTWRHESGAYLEYLRRLGMRVPLDGSFPYTTEELVRRGLIRRATARRLAGAPLTRLTRSAR